MKPVTTHVITEDAQLRCEHTPHAGTPALLLLHSLGSQLEMWDDQAAALSERFELIRYDVRGHGRSSSGSRAELTMDQLARDALAVLNACGVVRAHLCGLSMGGMTAVHIAHQWPDRVLKVVLSNTAPHMPPRESWDARIAIATSQGMAPLVEAVLERWFTADFHAAEPAKVDRIRQMLLTTDPQGFAACCAAIRDMDQREAIKSITARILVIAGTRDLGTTPQIAESMANAIPGAKLALLDAAHLSNIEQAPQFTAALLEFLAT